MGNEGGCNANNDEATCNAPLRNNMFAKWQVEEIAAVNKRVDDNLIALETAWKNASNAPVNNQPLATISCCQAMIFKNIDADTINFDGLTNCCNGVCPNDIKK